MKTTSYIFAPEKAGEHCVKPIPSNKSELSHLHFTAAITIFDISNGIPSSASVNHRILWKNMQMIRQTGKISEALPGRTDRDAAM